MLGYRGCSLASQTLYPTATLGKGLELCLYPLHPFPQESWGTIRNMYSLQCGWPIPWERNCLWLTR